MAKAIIAATPGDDLGTDKRLRPAVSYDPMWGAIAILSLLALGLLAPSGLWLLAFIGVIILVHEAGHFFVAKASGMQPTEFSGASAPRSLQYKSVHFGSG